VNVTEQILVGGADCFMTVRHLALRGTNFEIGRAVGALAVERHGHSAERYATEPLYARARRAYFQQHYPIHWQRVRGVAAAFDIDPEDDRYDLSALMYNMDLPRGLPGCSVVYYPPAATATGGGCLSRNYDFSTGALADLVRLPLPPQARAQVPSMMSETYIMEWYPEDGGYATLAIQGCDLLSGTFDGINSAGLVVAILADDEGIARLGPNIEMHLGPPRAIGLHELQLMRLLLDTCTNADEACAALLAAKDLYMFAPLHYIVADRTGASFVYENSTGRNTQYLFAGDGRPQVVTAGCAGANRGGARRLPHQGHLAAQYRRLAPGVGRSAPFSRSRPHDPGHHLSRPHPP
jgi:hypothetical protein